MSVDQLKIFLARMQDDPSLREAVQGSATAGGSLRARERASCWMPMERPAAI
ncbi:MAG: Nif11-like leader peptide family natural product precursor [Cyanobacteriota bacterium]